MTTWDASDGRDGDGSGCAWAEVAPIALVRNSADGRPLGCNECWRQYTGTAADEAPEGWAERLHPDDGLADVWARSLRSGTPFEAECRLRGGDGHRWFLVRSAPVRNDSGAVASWVSACTDVDDLVRAREKQALAVADLERFAAIAAHDLQEPLRKVEAFADRLAGRHGEGLDDQGKDYIRRIAGAVVRMRGLIHDILEYSRAGLSGKRARAVDLSALAAEVVADLSGAIERGGGAVEVGPLPTVRADATQMRQLLQNLIANGLKFGRPGVPPRVKVSGRVEAGRCIIEVSDDGVGFPPEHAIRIFEPFRRLHGRNEYQGTGLGLAICRRIVDRHAGAIVADGAPGAGAVFRVTLPDGADDPPEI